MLTAPTNSRSPLSTAVTLGNAAYHGAGNAGKAEYVTLEGEPYIRIRDVDALDPFLMSLVSNSDHWLFVGSNTPFTAGRVDPDHALFPYQTVDRILRSPDTSGALSVFLVQQKEGWALWEPWQRTSRVYRLERNLYKHVLGTAVVFEEINPDLGLRFAWSLTTSDIYGIVRHCTLENLTGEPISVRYLDGWHQLITPGLTQDGFQRYSYLAAAYMRHESEQALGIFTLNAGMGDRPEPIESLRAACAWSLGHKNPTVVLSDRQVESFRCGREIHAEREVRGYLGAYLVADSVCVAPKKEHGWFTVADTGLDHSAVVHLRNRLASPDLLEAALLADVKATHAGIRKRIAATDGLQQTADQSVSAHHFANVLFNCMRGGTLDDSYAFASSDFAAFLRSRNTRVFQKHATWLSALPVRLDLAELRALAASRGDAHLARLAREYLPLTFSRRHGDPSRPWNHFAIHIKNEKGEPIHGYQGNWRDIFQNWESLAQSYPDCLVSMIAIFLNASTADGYNPYRITREGIEWETIDPHDFFTHIGYWGDHQIIYLLRLLESYERFQPGSLSAALNEMLYAYAAVPYKIAGFADILRDPRNSIRFDQTLHRELIANAETLGNDGKLHSDANGEAMLVTLAEKLFVPLLAKLSNLVPDGGVWLNTQRPEWNDANNALAGWGLSMVTVNYMRRYLVFLDRILAKSALENVQLTGAVAGFIEQITRILEQPLQSTPAGRFKTLSELGHAGEAHRAAVYSGSFGELETVTIGTLRQMISAALRAVNSTIRANQRPDGMVQSYNILDADNGSASIRNLYLMLEGQVAALSSGLLGPGEVLTLLKALRESDLYRADQQSYILYPDRDFASYSLRNILPPDWTAKAPLLATLADADDRTLVLLDEEGKTHFHGDITNASDLNIRLDRLARDARWSEAVQRDREAVLELWESLFHHHAFTGRSGIMFAFEGLGSIYWHMIAKLLLAVQEAHQQAVVSGSGAFVVDALGEAYDAIRSGLGFTKTPALYGAFPSDPYSHSPSGRGAQQPGMTGQVKEEILTRMGELGVEVKEGCLCFEPCLLRLSEFVETPHAFDFIAVDGHEETWQMPAHSLGFTYCQIPVCYFLAQAFSIVIQFTSGEIVTIPGNKLSSAQSRSIFARDGKIAKLTVAVPGNILR